jgi:hypothetical protein
MIKEIMKLFSRKKVVAAPTPDPLEGVGEPVITFVNLIKENPLRFRVRVVDTYPGEHWFGYTKEVWKYNQDWNMCFVSVRDKVKGIEFKAQVYQNRRIYKVQDLGFELTWQESDQIVKALVDVFEASRLRQNRIARLKSEAKYREQRKKEELARQAWIEVYCAHSEEGSK